MVVKLVGLVDGASILASRARLSATTARMAPLLGMAVVELRGKGTSKIVVCGSVRAGSFLLGLAWGV